MLILSLAELDLRYYSIIVLNDIFMLPISYMFYVVSEYNFDEIGGYNCLRLPL
jgi:hypothetical protein